MIFWYSFVSFASCCISGMFASQKVFLFSSFCAKYCFPYSFSMSPLNGLFITAASNARNFGITVGMVLLIYSSSFS